MSPGDLLVVQVGQGRVGELGVVTHDSPGKPCGGDRIGVRSVGVLDRNPVCLTEYFQGTLARPVLVDLLVEDEGIDHEQSVSPSEPLD